MAIYVGSVLLAGVVVLFVLLPLIEGRHAPLTGEATETTEAEARARILLGALEDVEYDFHTGKLDDPDYAHLKAEVGREALAAVRARERERDQGPSPAAGESMAREARDGPDGLASLEEEILRARDALRAGALCARCEHPNAPGSRFCGHCGARLGA